MAVERPSGFGLVEVLVAVLILSLAATGVAQLSSSAARANHDAGSRTMATILAAQKLKQLRSLDWAYASDDAGPQPWSDGHSDLSIDPATSAGTGLRPSSVMALERSTSGFVDYLDGRGIWLGTGDSPASGTAFVRRWAITRLPSDPDHSLVLQVRVTALRREVMLTGPTAPGSLPDEVWLTTVVTRKAS